MAKKKIVDQHDLDFLGVNEDNVIKSPFEDVIGDRFGEYSKYIIQDRALPDLRDGLKPVQRRILFGMKESGMVATSDYKKSARIVGDVMGKYHPHGDSSIYDAMVRMSQWWKNSETFIDMQGNNGSMDDDPAAAMPFAPFTSKFGKRDGRTVGSSNVSSKLYTISTVSLSISRSISIAINDKRASV